jgi:zinc finger protein
MSHNQQEDPKSDGKAFDDFFDSIGNKAENVTASKAKTDPVATNGAQVAEEDEKVVDEIESLCMNCRENASNLLDRSPHELIYRTGHD